MSSEINWQKKPAVFLDRDGVLTEERGYIDSLEKLMIFPYTADCVKMMHTKGYYAIVITNQSGVARGLFSEEKLQVMNDFLMKQTKVDAIYYCPHHPEGKMAPYRKKCRCRKPSTGMIEVACAEFAIDVSRSFMIGDRTSDILAGQKIGLKTILLESGYGLADMEDNVVPDYIVKDLRDTLTIL